MVEKSNINVIMRATSITPRKLYDLINRNMIQSYLIDYLTLLKRKMLLLCLKGLCQPESMRSEVMQITFNCQNSIVFNA